VSATIGRNIHSSLLSVCLVIAILWGAQSFLIPTALALLFSFVGGRSLSILNKRGFGQRTAVVVLSSAVILGFVLGTWILGHQILEISKQSSTYRVNLSTKARALQTNVDEVIDRFRITIHGPRLTGRASIAPVLTMRGSNPTAIVTAPPATNLVASANQDSSTEVIDGLQENVPALFHFLGISAFVIVLSLFLSVYRDDIRDRLIRLAGERNIYLTNEMLNEIGAKVSSYLWTQLSVNAVFGFTLSALFYFLDLKYALLWGMMIGLLRFVPFIGVFLGALLPFLFALADDSGWGTAWLVVGTVFFTNFLLSQFVEPHVIGRRLGLSPVAVLVSAFFWTLVWGVAGLVLATPFTACLVVAGRYFQPLEFATILFSDEPALNPGLQLYRRALTQVDLRTDSWLSSFIHSVGMEKFLMLALFPALRLLASDRRRGQFSNRRLVQICNVLRSGFSSSSGKRQRAETLSSPQPPVVIFALCDEADGVMARGLAKFLEQHFAPQLLVRVVARPVSAARMAEVLANIQPSLWILCSVSTEQKDIEARLKIWKRYLDAMRSDESLLGNNHHTQSGKSAFSHRVMSYLDSGTVNEKMGKGSFPTITSLTELNEILEYDLAHANPVVSCSSQGDVRTNPEKTSAMIIIT